MDMLWRSWLGVALLMSATSLWACAATVQSAAAPEPTIADSGQGALTWLNRDVVFASREQCASILGASDAFTRTQSPMDRGVRMMRVEPVSEEAFLSFAASACLDWGAEERAVWQAVAERVGVALEGLAMPLPPRKGDRRP